MCSDESLCVAAKLMRVVVCYKPRTLNVFTEWLGLVPQTEPKMMSYRKKSPTESLSVLICV
jgi:hypothetical protein